MSYLLQIMYMFNAKNPAKLILKFIWKARKITSGWNQSNIHRLMNKIEDLGQSTYKHDHWLLKVNAMMLDQADIHSPPTLQS